MTTAEITAALTFIRQETDLNSKALLMAGLVSELFRERGFEPVVVGGSTIEFYTNGAYMTGDTDICWTGWPQGFAHAAYRAPPGMRCQFGRHSGSVTNSMLDMRDAKRRFLTHEYSLIYDDASNQTPSRQPQWRPAVVRAVGAIDVEGSAAARGHCGGCDDGERA